MCFASWNQTFHIIKYCPRGLITHSEGQKSVPIPSRSSIGNGIKISPTMNDFMYPRRPQTNASQPNSVHQGFEQICPPGGSYFDNTPP